MKVKDTQGRFWTQINKHISGFLGRFAKRLSILELLPVRTRNGYAYKHEHVGIYDQNQYFCYIHRCLIDGWALCRFHFFVGYMFFL